MDLHFPTSALFTWHDALSISPLLVLLLGALLCLLVEIFSVPAARQASFFFTVLSFVAAITLSWQAPLIEGDYLTLWLWDGLGARTWERLFFATGLLASVLTYTFYARRTKSSSEFFFLILASTCGLYLIAHGKDWLTVFLGLETFSIALYILVAYLKSSEQASEAAMKYFILGSVGSALLLYGIALWYGQAGNTQLDMSDYANASLMLKVGLALIAVGLCFKAGLVPFHQWLPDVYQGSSAPLVAFMMVATKAAAFYVLYDTLGDYLQVSQDPVFTMGFLTLVWASLIVGNLMAIRQSNLLRLFAFSGISHSAYLLLNMLTGANWDIFYFYMSVYALATFAVFAVLVHLPSKEGLWLPQLEGLAYRSPWQAFVLAVGVLTMAGIPPLPGFFAKFQVLNAAFAAGYFWTTLLALGTTVLGAYYYLRLLGTLFTRAEHEARDDVATALLALACVAGLLVVGLAPNKLYDATCQQEIAQKVESKI